MKNLILYCLLFSLFGAAAQADTALCNRRKEIVGAVEYELKKNCADISNAEIDGLAQLQINFPSKPSPISANDLEGFNSLKRLSVLQNFHNYENTDAFILTRDALRSTPSLEYLYTSWTPEDHASFKETLSYLPKLKTLLMADQNYSQIRFPLEESDFARNPELEVLKLSVGRNDTPTQIQGDLFKGNPRLNYVEFNLKNRKVQFGDNFHSLNPSASLYFASYYYGLSFAPNSFKDVKLSSLVIPGTHLNVGLFPGAQIGKIELSSFKPEFVSNETFAGMGYLGILTLSMDYYAPQGIWVFPEDFFSSLRFVEGLAITMSSSTEWKPKPDFLVGFDKLRELSVPGQIYDIVGPITLFNQLPRLETLKYDPYWRINQDFPPRRYNRSLGSSCFSPGTQLKVGDRCSEDHSVYAGLIQEKKIFSTPSNCNGGGCSGGIPIETRDEISATWNGASSFCQKLQFGGHQDWRLPTMDELSLLYQNQDAIGGFNRGNDEVNWGIYWSSDSITGYPDLSRIVMFSGTPPLNSNWPKDRLGFYRCVRSVAQ